MDDDPFNPRKRSIPTSNNLFQSYQAQTTSMNNQFRSRQLVPMVTTINSIFKPNPTQNQESENPFQKRREPAPTRHKRFKNPYKSVSEQEQACDECIGKIKVAKEYWNRNKELEEEVAEQADFIELLKGQRRELEEKVGILLGQIDSMKRGEMVG